MTRDRLIFAAYQVFSRSGYSNSSIRDITDASDVNRATFYLHFSGKAEIFLAAADNMLVQTGSKYWKSLDSALTIGSRESIREWIMEAANWWLDNAKFLTAWSEASAMEVSVRITQREFHAKLARNLIQYRASFSNEAEQDQEVEIVQLLVVQLDELFSQYWLVDTPENEKDRVLHLLTEIWYRTLHIDR